MLEESHDPAVPSMKLPILYSALMGWASVALLMVTTGAGSFSGGIWLPILIYTAYSGGIAVPSCLLAGVLVNEYLPPSSPWWQPKYAALCGGLIGPVVLYLIFAILSREFEFSAGRWLSSIIAAVPGAVCGFSLAQFKQKLLKLEAPALHS